MLDSRGLQVHYRKGTKVMVIRAFDGSLYSVSYTHLDVYKRQVFYRLLGKGIQPPLKSYRMCKPHRYRAGRKDSGAER